ncbi:hypothetical protein [Fusicatenibacter saccharivorans]|uniref:hypothetical protein n=1 Tax=Fusicatenibacter saccharivorans TaxID=1150298 RepID=UPI0032BFA795
MSKVLCPECRKILSQYAESCPNCSFPIAKYVQDAHLTDFSKTFICPKCGYWSDMNSIAGEIMCEYCHLPMFQTDEDGDVTLKATLNMKTAEEQDAYIYSLLERCGKTDEYSEEAHQNFRRKLHELAEEERKKPIQPVSQQQSTPSSPNQPHCPVCQSTNIEKIGMFKRILSTSMFGIASDKVGKQWHCKNCGNNF